tara:strand:+ start:841 stop:1038 length:198 start_codon:yes stop_codon:yes gene_type:complete
MSLILGERKIMKNEYEEKVLLDKTDCAENTKKTWVTPKFFELGTFGTAGKSAFSATEQGPSIGPS